MITLNLPSLGNWAAASAGICSHSPELSSAVNSMAFMGAEYHDSNVYPRTLAFHQTAALVQSTFYSGHLSESKRSVRKLEKKRKKPAMPTHVPDTTPLPLLGSGEECLSPALSLRGGKHLLVSRFESVCPCAWSLRSRAISIAFRGDRKDRRTDFHRRRGILLVVLTGG